jgi:hypothetical protein
LLSRSGYEVQDRPVDAPANRAALNELGYLSVPVVVVAGRAFPGFPRRTLAANLGLARTRFSAAATRRTLARSLAALEELAALLPQLPLELWHEQAYPRNPDRDHTFGHFTWGVFRFLELTLAAPEQGMPWEQLQDSVQLADWRSAPRFTSFADVRDYALPLLDRGRAWAASLTTEEMRAPVETPWGRLELHVLLGILSEHTDIKQTHLRRRLGADAVRCESERLR